MDTIKTLTEWILSRAEQESEIVLRDAERHKTELLQKLEAELARRHEEQCETLNRQSAQRLSEEERQAETAAAKQKSAFIQARADAVFAQAEAALCALSPAEFLAFYECSLAQLSLCGDYTLRLGEKTARTLTAEQIGALARKTQRYSVTGAEPIPMQGGFVLECPPVEYNFLYGELLHDLKSREGAELMKRIFETAP